MKICVVVPSVEYLAQAGVRIRYRRIEPHLAKLGHRLVIEVIENFRKADHLGCDAYIFSKCYDARAVTLARMMRAIGKLAAIDLFDDMFSQTDDSRFVRHRAWLREIAGALDFALCSTQRMREIFRGYAPGVPAHVLNDPFETFDMDRLGRRIEAKRQEALAERRIKVAWFGVGDNPHFTVGLPDLAAFGEDIRRLGDTGFAVSLDVLTNRRALTADGLKMIGRLAIPHRIAEWTREREIDLLDESLVSFLPVNGQGFSNAKSLNRAVTALTGGTQVLSVGYPLYQPLGDFLYRDPATLLADIEAGTLRLGAHTMPKLEEAFGRFGDPTNEVAKLAEFLLGVAPGKKGPAASVAVLHGRRSPIMIHKQTQRLSQLSVATPFSQVGVNHDVRVMPVAGSRMIDVRLSNRARQRLSAEDAAFLVADKQAPDTGTVRLIAPAAVVDRLSTLPADGLAGVTTGYEAVVKDVAAVVHRLFPATHTILSEAEAPLAANISVPDDPARVLHLTDESKLERILFVANAQIPSLHISFIRPLEPFVAEGRLKMMTLTDTELRHQFQRNPKTRLTKRYVTEAIEAFDPTLIIFCRYSGVLAEEYKAFAAKKKVPIVFHIDDDLLNIPPEIGQKKYEYHSAPERVGVIRDLLEKADLVYASTANLGALLERERITGHLKAGKIYCSAEVRRAPMPRPVRKFGYMGGGDHGYDLETVVPAIAEMLDRRPVLEFEIFGGIAIPERLERFGARISHVPPIADYAAFLRHFATMDWDIGICPLTASPFNACKANTKWIEYTAVGIAVVATRGMAYDECCAGGAGLLADTVDDWIDTLDRLTGEDGLCYRQTLIAQEKLRAEYSAQALQSQILDLVEPLLGRPLLFTPHKLAASATVAP